MGSMVYQCHGCGISIDPTDQVTRMVKDVETRHGGSIDPTGTRREQGYAHDGHEAWYVARGFRATDRGALSDLTAR